MYLIILGSLDSFKKLWCVMGLGLVGGMVCRWFPNPNFELEKKLISDRSALNKALSEHLLRHIFVWNAVDKKFFSCSIGSGLSSSSLCPNTSICKVWWLVMVLFSIFLQIILTIFVGSLSGNKFYRNINIHLRVTELGQIVPTFQYYYSHGRTKRHG